MQISAGSWQVAARRRRATCPIRHLVLMAIAAACASACSDLNVERSGAFDDRRPAANREGIFKPGNVVGLEFAAAEASGVTDGDGRFTCSTDRPIRFSIGAVELGEAVCRGIVHPASLTASGSLTDPVAINMTRFLLLLDDDQQIGNGIVIPEALRALADSWPAIDFAADDFEGELVRVLSDIASVEGRDAVTMPTSAEGASYLDASLSCAYSGLFVNSFIAGAFTAPTEVALIVYRDPETTADVFSVRVRRNHPQSQMYLEAHGTVELGTLPTLIMGDRIVAGTVDASYLTPDLIIGSFDNAIAQQPIDRSGGFEALRIGDAPGEFRFVGSFERPGEAMLPVIMGLVSFALDGDTITGEAFDMMLGGSGTMTGQRLPDSNTVEFSTGFAPGTATGTLITDADGNIVGFEGAWPGSDDDATVNAVACRQN